MDEKNEQDDALNHQEEADLDTAADDVGDESIDEVKTRLEAAEAARVKAEEIAENQRIRAEKAERKFRDSKPSSDDKLADKPVEKPVAKTDLTAMDTIALIDAQVTAKEDIEEVLDYAKHKNISIVDALQASVVKTILAEKKEQRASAEAANTSVARRGSTKPTAEKIMSDAAQGKLPDDPADLAEAWIQSKKKK